MLLAKPMAFRYIKEIVKRVQPVKISRDSFMLYRFSPYLPTNRVVVDNSYLKNKAKNAKFQLTPAPVVGKKTPPPVRLRETMGDAVIYLSMDTFSAYGTFHPCHA
jgi:hypothetical protein